MCNGGRNGPQSWPSWAPKWVIRASSGSSHGNYKVAGIKLQSCKHALEATALNTLRRSCRRVYAVLLLLIGASYCPRDGALRGYSVVQNSYSNQTIFKSILQHFLPEFIGGRCGEVNKTGRPNCVTEIGNLRNEMHEKQTLRRTASRKAVARKIKPLWFGSWRNGRRVIVKSCMQKGEKDGEIYFNARW